jgi:hypothetical protein
VARIRESLKKLGMTEAHERDETERIGPSVPGGLA